MKTVWFRERKILPSLTFLSTVRTLPNYFVFSKIVFSAKNGFFRGKFSVNSAKIR